MTSISRRVWLGLESLLTINLLLACATDRDRELGREVTGGDDAGVMADDAGDLDASPETDAATEATTCSSSKICVVPAPIDRTLSLTSVWGSSANDVWAVGTNSTILHYDGQNWEKAEHSTPDGSGSFTLRSVWLERPDDVWIADGNRVRHATGWKGPAATEWSHFTYGEYLSNEPLTSAIRGKGNTIWIARGLSPNWNPFATAWALARSDGWIAGGPNTQQRINPGDVSLTSLTMSRVDELWAIGICGTTRNCVLRGSPATVDGGAPGGAPPDWRLEEHDSRSVRRLFGTWGDENAVWLVGEGGTIRRMTASAVPSRKFEIVESRIITDLYGLFGFAPDDVWAVGEAATVLHWDGVSWSRLSTPFDDAPEKPRLLGVWGSSSMDVWIVGEGTVLHFQENQ